MHKLKDILIVTLLMILVFMTCAQEGDILNLKRRTFAVEGGLMSLCGWVAQSFKETDPVKGGLAPAEGGLGLQHFLSCSATLFVTERARGPISFGTRLTRSTGVFVSDNILLTAKHSVEDRINDAGVKIIGPDGVTYTAIEVLEDADDDIALVIIQGRCGPWLELGPCPSLGDNVICIGAPLNEYTHLIITWGRVSSENYFNTFIYDGFAWSGCSGGPVIVDGKVAGIVESKLSRTASLGFATPVNRLDPGLMARIR